MPDARFLELRSALREFRAANRYKQDDLAEILGISRKTYHLFESCRWLPSKRERGHFIGELHKLDVRLAERLVSLLGCTVEDHVLVRTVQPTPGQAAPAMGAVEAKRAFDVAVYETAEELDMSPQTLRPVVAALLGKLASTEISLAQAAAIAKAASSAKAKVGA